MLPMQKKKKIEFKQAYFHDNIFYMEWEKEVSLK